MAPTETAKGVNLNTIIMVGGFVITIGGGLVAFGAERGQNARLHAEAQAQISIMRETQNTMEARLRATELMQASQSSDLRAIQSGVMRIEARLDKVLTAKSSEGNP